MLKDCNVVNERYKQQKATPEESENWLSMEEIKQKYNEYLNEVVPMLNHKSSINDKKIIDFFIIALMSGVAGIPTRRSQDWSVMKIRNYNRDTDNYYENGKFTFNVYKTFKVYGRAVIDVKQMAPDLDKLIKKWIKINKTDYLIFSTNFKPLSNSQLYQYNNKIWGKAVSTDMYRKIYLTDFYKKPHSLIDMEKMAQYCGHSVMTAMSNYVKLDEQ